MNRPIMPHQRTYKRPEPKTSPPTQRSMTEQLSLQMSNKILEEVHKKIFREANSKAALIRVGDLITILKSLIGEPKKLSSKMSKKIIGDFIEALADVPIITLNKFGIINILEKVLLED